LKCAYQTYVIGNEKRARTSPEPKHTLGRCRGLLADQPIPATSLAWMLGALFHLLTVLRKLAGWMLPQETWLGPRGICLGRLAKPIAGAEERRLTSPGATSGPYVARHLEPTLPSSEEPFNNLCWSALIDPPSQVILTQNARRNVLYGMPRCSITKPKQVVEIC
jgi:hypothetical protein